MIMCIKSCKSSPFLKPKSSSALNPNAQEWRPPHLHRHHPAPPPTLTAAHVVAPAALPLQKPLLCHLPPQPQCYYHLPRPWPPIIYHSPPPFSILATGRLYSLPPPPVFGDEVKGVGQLEEKRVEKCLEKLESPIVKGRSKLGVSKTPPPQPRRRWEWKPRKTVACAANAAAAAASPTSPLIKELSSRTTVMVKNIPNQLRRDFMLEFLDSYCKTHLLEYDFMYLPMDFRSKDNLGYAFVNFTNGEYALKFKKILHRYKWGAVETENGVYRSKKICAITWARIQGKEKLVKRFENSSFACDNPDFLPVVFDPPRGGSNATSPVIVGRLGQHVMT